MNKLFKFVLGVAITFSLVGCSSNIDRSDITADKGDLVVVSSEEVLNKADEGGTFVFIITQTNCSHCKQYEPNVAEVCVDESIKVYQVVADKDDSDALDTLMERFEIEYTPTTFVIVEGELKDSFVGNISVEELKDYFKKHKVID
ncbi:MAG: thioredoxin family protein [Erysipelotrichales bacterium]|nr:thioredoxin family protein [Erysipelotrichales bacterium]